MRSRSALTISTGYSARSQVWSASASAVAAKVLRASRDAGVEARRRMAAAGYDAANGDTWAINEFPSSVRRDDGTARSDAREFVRGLYEGDGRPLQ